MLKLRKHFLNGWFVQPAAFGRLCVETLHCNAARSIRGTQPPSGGCVLKHGASAQGGFPPRQPPSGGCVLKHLYADEVIVALAQPPSGGCVLKQQHRQHDQRRYRQPPSGGCVLKRP